MKKKVVILGSTGMLGNAVFKHFKQSNKYIVYPSHRKEECKLSPDSFYFDALNTDLSAIPDCDYVINCIGIIKPFMVPGDTNCVKVNAVFPIELSKYCDSHNKKLIHITTDCVFSGKSGNYSENSEHDACDDYGKSKSAGEPSDCMVIRTSIIGEEIHKHASLIEWVKKNKNKQINGFTNHFWNGVTTKHYAEICSKIIDNNLYDVGLFHVHSNVINKYQLLQMINKKFDLNISVVPMETPVVDRTLKSDKELVEKLDVKSIQQQIDEL